MKRVMCFCVAFLTAVVVFVNIAFLVKDSFFYSINNLPEGTFVREEFNQNLLFSTGYKLRVYQVEKTRHFPSAVRVELCNDVTGECRNIYWQTDTEGTVISWSEDDVYVVNINGVPINIIETEYDCRDYYDHTYVAETN